MQEQHLYKVTPDQGWEKMKSILDKAMPEDEPRRRYPFLWWSASSVVIIAVMGVLLLDGQSKAMEQTIPIVPGVHAPVGHTPPMTKTPATVSHHQMTPIAPADAKAQESASNPESPEEKINPIRETKRVYKPEGTSSVPSGAKGQSNPTDPKDKVVPMAMVTEPEVTEPVVPIEEHPYEAENAWMIEDEAAAERLTTGIVTIYEEKYREARVIEPLPTGIPMSVQSSDAGDQIITGDAMKYKWRTPFVEPHAAVSGLIGVNGGLGLFGGAGVNLNIAKRFSVTTAIGYLSFHPNSFLSNGLKALDSNAEYNTIVNYDPAYQGNESYVYADNVNSQAGYHAINPLVDQLTQWQISTGLRWKVTPRFFTEGGAQFGFSTRACSEFPIVTVEQVGSSAPATRFNNSLEEYDVIRSSTTSIYLGMGYRFGPHFDIFTNWTHGLDTYILNEPNQATEANGGERTDYIRGLSMGLRYTL